MIATATQPKPRRRWRIVAGLLALLLVVGWWMLTSEPVVKALLLPRVASALHADLTAEQLKLSPFSSLDLKNVTLTPAKGKPLAKFAGIKVRYQLMAYLLSGKLVIDELELDQPVITVHQREDGQSNLTDWLAGLNAEESSPATSRTDGERLFVLIGNPAIHNGVVHYNIARSKGSTESLTIDGLEFKADRVKNGGQTKGKLTAAYLVESRDPRGNLVDSLSGGLELSGLVTLDDNFVPGDLDSRLRLSVGKATGRWMRAAEVSATLNARGSLQELDELTLSISRAEQETDRMEVKGGYDIASGSGSFDVRVSRMTPFLLELAAAKSGIDVDLADFVSTNRLTISQRGRAIAATGDAYLRGFRAKRGASVTPVLDAELSFDAGLDVGAGTASIGRLQLDARQAGQPLVAAHVSEPLHYAWQGPGNGAADGAMTLQVSNLRLLDWRQFAGDPPLDGVLSAVLEVTSPEPGQELTINTRASLEQGEIAVGTNRWHQLAVALEAKGSLSAARELQLSHLNIGLAQSGQPVGELSGNARLGLNDLTAAAETKITANLPALATLAGGLPANVSAGTATLKTTAGHSVGRFDVHGALSVSELAASLDGATFIQVQFDLPFELTQFDQELQWKTETTTVNEGGAIALQFATSGQFHLTNRTGRLEIALPLLTERLVNPFLAAHAPTHRLRSAEVSATLKGELSGARQQHWFLTAQSTNVVLVDTNNMAIGPVLGSRGVFDIEVGPVGDEVVLNRWEGRWFADGQAAGELTAAGAARWDGTSARFDGHLTGLDEKVLGPLAALVLGDRRIDRAKLTADALIDYEATRPSQVRLGLTLRDVNIYDPQGWLPEHPRDIDMRLTANLATNRFEITEGRINMTPTGGLSNRVNVAGWVDFARPSALRGKLALESPGVDLSPLYSLLDRRRGDTNAPDVDAVSDSVRDAKTAVTTPSLPVERFDLTLDVQRLKLRALTLSNWLAQATAYSNAVALPQFSLQVNEAPFNASLLATNVAGSLRYQLAAETERFRFNPVFRTFYPDWPGQEEAELYGAVHLTGTAPAGSNLWTASIGDVYLGITNASYQPLSARWRNTLQPVALLLQTPELFSAPITWAYLHNHVSNQVLTIKDFTVISDAYILDTTNSIPLGEDYVSSAIPPAPVNLLLSRNLLTGLGWMKAADTNRTSSYILLPNFLTLTGTIGEPKLDIDKVKLTGMTLGKAGDFLAGSAGDLLKKAGGVTETVGGIVSGRKFTGSEKADANIVSKGIEGVFDVVGGILGGTGKAVDAGTGAVTGSKVIDPKTLALKLSAFDWPRVFTNVSVSQPTDP